MRNTRSLRSKTARRSCRGLTLLELVVVMAILIALAAILVPMLPNMLSNANNATGTVNVAELNKAIQTYQSTNYQYPDDYDSLIGSGASAGELAPQVLLNGWSMVATDMPVVSTWSQPQLTSLSNAGITTVYNLVDRTTDPTLSATFPGVVTTTTGMGTGMSPPAPVPTPIGASTPLLTAIPTYVQQVFGPGAVPAADLLTGGTGTYVVLGIGAYCSLVGDRNCGVAEAPVRGTPAANDDPSKTYGRYVAVYRVDGSNSASAAVLVGCACPGAMGLMASEGMEQKYYSTVHQ